MHSKIPGFNPRTAVKFIIDNALIFTLAIVSGGMLLWPRLRGADAGAVSASGAVQLINRDKAVLIDVRETEEFASSHIANARHIPLNQLEEKLSSAVKNKALPLILVCATGARANRALGIAKKLGYAQAQVLSGGLKAWDEAKLPLEKSRTKAL